MMVEGGLARELRLQLRHEWVRASAVLRRPRPGVWIAVGLPILLVGAALATAGSAALPDPNSPDGAIGLAFLISAPLAFIAYGVLFRPRDDGLIRRLGFSPTSLFLVRALRLGLLAAAVTALLLLPFVVDGRPLARPLGILVAAASAATGAALLALTHAAALTAHPRSRPGFFSGLMGLDRELVRVGPIVYAPLAPLIAAIAVGVWLGIAPGVAVDRFAVIAAVSVAMGILAIPRFSRAIGRFAPRAQEMAYAPPPDVAETGLMLDRGLARLLPIRSRAVLARDALVVGRRFRWASSIVWPVAIVSTVALARWGEIAAVRSWILGAGVLTLIVQAFAVIGIGRIEAAGARWVDQAAGLRFIDRWFGRTAFGLGLSLWLTVPLGMAWALWAEVGSGWAWMIAGAGSAAVAATASTSAAKRWR